MRPASGEVQAIMGKLLRLFKHRDIVGSLLEAIIDAVERGGPYAEIRARLADGVQRGDVVSDDALARVKATNERLRK